MNVTGSIQVIYGPMFSGKSSELLMKIRRFQIARKKCLVANYSHDNRYSTEEVIATHDKVTKKATKVSSLMSLMPLIKDYDVIGIDEGQFFADVVQFSEKAANLGKLVVVAALDSTFERKAFGEIIKLIPLAQKVTKLNAVCVYCKGQAGFTKRIVQRGDEMYKPVCRRCFFVEETPRTSNTSTCSQQNTISLKKCLSDINPQRKIAIKEISS